MPRALIALCLASALCLSGCGAVRLVGRSLNAIATALCETVAADQYGQELDGMSPEEWCSIKSNLDPFLSVLLAAQRDAAAKAGLRPIECDAGLPQ